jgi:hypothetical protein
MSDWPSRWVCRSTLEVGLKMQKDAREKKDDIAPGLKRGASVSERG